MHFDAKLDRYLRSKEKAARRGTVRIENPIPGGATYLKADRALWHYERGNCTFSADGKSIRFNNTSVDRAMRSYEQAARADSLIRNGIASYHGIKGLPLTKPMDLLAPVKKRHFWSKASVHHDVRRTRPQR